MKKIDFDWEDEIEKDIEGDHQRDDTSSWVSPLSHLYGLNDYWLYSENRQLEWERWNLGDYKRIQSEGTGRFYSEWNEKMKRQKRGNHDPTR